MIFFKVVYYICNVISMYLSRAMRSFYLKVFFWDFHATTQRYFGTAPCAVTSLVCADITDTPIIAGSEMK